MNSTFKHFFSLLTCGKELSRKRDVVCCTVSESGNFIHAKNVLRIPVLLKGQHTEDLRCDLWGIYGPCFLRDQAIVLDDETRAWLENNALDI